VAVGAPFRWPNHPGTIYAGDKITDAMHAASVYPASVTWHRLPVAMEIKIPSTGSHRLDWFLMLALVIVLLIIFI
jgi:hypothetical protein